MQDIRKRETAAGYGRAARRPPNSLRLAPQDGDWRALVPATDLTTHADGVQGRDCNHVGRDPSDVTSAGLLVNLRRERRQLFGEPTAFASACSRPTKPFDAPDFVAG